MSHRPDPGTEPLAALLLDEIHAALLRHDYQALPPLGLALEAELDHPSERLDAPAVALIRQRADRNAATLLATSRGIRAALRRLADVRRAGGGLVTYDRTGRHETRAAGTPLGRF